MGSANLAEVRTRLVRRPDVLTGGGPALRKGRRRLFGLHSVRRRLLLLAVLAAAPTVLVAAFLSFWSYQRERDAAEQALVGTAQALSLAVDGQFGKAEAFLHALSVARSLDENDFSTFDVQVRKALGKSPDWVILQSADGRQIINTRLPRGQAPPSGPAPVPVSPVLKAGKATVTDFLTIPGSQEQMVGVAMPLFRDGKPAFVLTLGMPPEELSGILSAQKWPKGWIGAILDRQGVIVARSENADRHVGHSATPDVMQAVARTSAGTLHSTSLDGWKSVVAWSRSPDYGWTFLVGVPRAQIASSAWKAAVIGFAFGAVAIAAGAGLALIVAGGITRPMRKLVDAADALGRGESPGPITTGLPAADEVAHAMRRSAEALRQREAELAASEARSRATFEAAPVGIAEVDLQSRILRANPTYHEIIGRGSEVIGTPFADFTHPDDVGLVPELFQSLVAGDTPSYRVEKRYIRPDGSIVWVDVFATLVRIAGVEPYVIGVVQDITGRKRALEAERQAELRFRATFEHAAVGVAHTDASGCWIRLNRRVAEILGYNPLDAMRLVRRRVLDFTHPDDAKRDQALFARQVAGELDRYELDKRAFRKDGSIVWVHLTSAVARDTDGKIIFFIRTLEDISDRKNAEQALAEESRTLEVINRTIATIAAELDLDKLVTAVTDAAVALTGAAFGAFFYNVVNDQGESYMLYTLSGAPRDAFEKFPMPRNTAVFGPTFHGTGIVRSDDILKDPRYGQNPPYSGMPPGHLPVRSYLAVPVISRSGEVVGGLFFGHPETKAFTARAERIAAAIAAQAAIAIDNARLYQAAQREIAERRRVDAALRDSEEQFRMLADSIPQLAWMAGHDGAIFWYNQRWYEYTGTTFEQMQGWGWRSVHDPEYLPQVEARFRQAMESGSNWEDTFPLRGKDGVYRWFLSRAQPIRDGQGRIARWFGTNTDITEQREAEAALRRINETLEQRVEAEVAERLKMEDALRQAQKMEAIGQLTGGVAHDFNNLLAVIMGNAELARRRGPDRLPALMDSILRAGQRGVALTRQLLSFSRRQPAAAQVLDLRREMPRVTEMLKASLRGNIELSVAVAPDTWHVEVDPSELEIALLNVAVNARDAMPDGGSFVIDVGNVTVTAGEVWGEPKLSGDHVKIALRDNGAGISADVLERVFEPFFTTKDVGAGTGLGLSQVYGFAHQSGGAVAIESQLEHGTCVKIFLPRTLSLPDAGAEPGHLPEISSPAPGLILVVEDNPDVAQVTAMMLRGMGYQVESVDRGRKALERLAQKPPPDLLLSDVVMPEGMSGADLAREARRRFPGLPVVLMSGYNDALPGDGANCRVLRKPISYEELSQIMREHLPAARVEVVGNG